ncbi:MAG: protein translocase subunit SecF [bacterium]|nr:protein translocase subunit SecF [bacterium]
MRGIQLVPHNTKIDFVRWRVLAFAISAFVVLLSLGSMFFQGLNYGIDFKGGFLIEIRTSEKADLAQLRSDLGSLNLGTLKLQSAGSDRDVMIRVERQSGGEESQNEALTQIRQTLGDGVEYRRVDSVGPTVSEDLKRNGIMAVGFALAAMLVYIWFRFEWQFSLCAVVALIHDAIAVMGLYALFQLEFNETVIIAILTTVGYSINDTVVVYDRVRENLRKFKKTSLSEIVNKSVNETLSRTVLTSGSTLLALGALYFFGGPVIASFSLPIIVGVGVGTYSSICLASLLLLMFDVRPPVEAEDAQGTQA